MNGAFHADYALDISGHRTEPVMLVMHWTFPGMGFGLGGMVEDVGLFGMADCRRPPGMAEVPGQVGNLPGGAPNPPYAN